MAIQRYKGNLNIDSCGGSMATHLGPPHPPVQMGPPWPKPHLESKQEACDVWGPGQVAPLQPDEVVDNSTPLLEGTVLDEVLADQVGTIYIANRLEVFGADMVLVPGCEPTSALTSYTLLMYRTCKAAMVHLHDALNAIPGSWVEWQVNNGQSNGSRKKWFVLPRVYQTCPSTPYPDFYKMLRDIPADEHHDDDLAKRCGTVDQGFPKDINKMLPPPVQPYVPEGTLSPWDLGSAVGPFYFDSAHMPDPEFTDDIPMVG